MYAEKCAGPGCSNLFGVEQSVPGTATWEGFCSDECMEAFDRQEAMHAEGTNDG
jgi:hypothetical protein